MANAMPQAEMRSGILIADDGTVYEGLYQVDNDGRVIMQIGGIVQKGSRPFRPPLGKIAIAQVEQDQIADIESAQNV